MTTTELNRHIATPPSTGSGFVYGTMFLDCSEEMANTVREKLCELFGQVELNSVGEGAFTFAVSA